MKEVINIYKQNRQVVENFLLNNIQSKHGHTCGIDDEGFRQCFQVLPGLSMTYTVNKAFTQTSPHFFRHKVDNTLLGADRTHFFSRVQFNEMGMFISNAYINSHTGRPALTIAKKQGDGFIVFDFDLVRVLEILHLVEGNRIFDFFTKGVYSAIGVGLAFFAIFLVGHAGVTFVGSVLLKEVMDLSSTFKAIISLTLGLAIFDLARTILQQEVLLKNYYSSGAKDSNVLVKFLISIIIALSIEALMVVFKIALGDYHDMQYAVYLILGVATLILCLGVFTFFVRRKDTETDDL